MAAVDQLLALLVAGTDREEPGEEVPGLTLTHHGLQCAALLRRQHPTDIDLQLAGLVHDVGHVSAPGEPDRHAATGAALVRPVLGDRVADLVARHVAAKRYLVAVEPGYSAQLSAGSQWSLGKQGAAMDSGEVAAFRSVDGWADAVTLRRADERAKDPGADVESLEVWIARLRDRVSRG